MQNLNKRIKHLILGATATLVVSQVGMCGNVPTELPGLLNFHEVHSYLYRGGEPSDKSLTDLKEKGVKTIIDLRGSSPKTTGVEQKTVEGMGMKYINLPMDYHAPTKAQVDEFIKTVEAAKADGGPVYVHCQHGSDRTGCLVGIWRVTHDGYTYEKALEEMHKYFYSPKFTQLSGAVKEYSEKEHAVSK